MKNVIVIGGGPAGMLAAATAANYGARVILLEKQERVGRKLKITGKGRCNITSAREQDFIEGYMDNGAFLYGALSEFSNWDVIDFFNSRGLATRVERGLRVFPISDNAEDVVEVLHSYMLKAGVRVLTNLEVRDIRVTDNKVTSVLTDKDEFLCEAVIVATGGLSYPATGSTGDGYRWARHLGHSIVDLRPGLVPLVVREDFVRDLQGLSLKNVKATFVTTRGKGIAEDFGEMLFTHYGVSGPIILSMSSKVGEYLASNDSEVKLLIDLKPALSEEKLDSRLKRDFESLARRQFKNALEGLLPRKLIPVFISLSGIDEDKSVSEITREERKCLLNLFKFFPLTITATRSIKEAIVTAGGINVKEVNPKTMESKLISNLFFAGEVLDIAGYTGGFNLQAAFSTGFVAGKYASGISA
ncbi:MAG: NAD(P)/FAD-dependent oxidoreductase [Syntrophomonadaceae bacterium]|nr:NAD(P)/FAD-dependent oxidoreductase [Syntrophomonadaceae bacterium]